MVMVVGACGDNRDGASDAAGDDVGDDVGADAPVPDAAVPDAAVPDAAVDADPCSACAEIATCDPSAPSPCVCPAGYDGDGTTAGTGCTDVDECSAGSDDCVDVIGACTNTDGGFTCACVAGYDGDGTTGGTGCTDIDECAGGTDGCVDAPGTCTNTDGSYSCGCEAGYDGDGTVAGTGCTDVDECVTGAAECDSFTCTNTPGAYRCDGIYAVQPFVGLLARLHPTTYQLLDVKRITSAAGTVNGITALVQHPTTGVAYAVGKVSTTAPNRVFGTFDFDTATLTAIGDPIDRFSSLAFLPDGTLYGTTGNGATTPETLFQIDPATGVTTLFSALGTGADGEVICFNPDDGMMYHWSGNGTAVMEKFALATPLSFVQVSPSLGTGEVFGCRYVGAGTFLLSDIRSQVSYVDSLGVVTPVVGAGTLYQDQRALISAAMTTPHSVRPVTGDVAGGTVVTIRGFGLAEATAVSVGGAAATSFTIVDDTTITAVVPAGTAGVVDVTVTLADGLTGTWAAAFTYTAAFGPPAPARTARPRPVAPSVSPGQLRKAAHGR